MLRRSRLALVMEGVIGSSEIVPYTLLWKEWYAPQGVARLPILAQDMEPADFHFKCLSGLYDRTQASEPFSECHIKFNRRLIVAAPLTIGDVCLRTPFLVCTGAPQTYLHDIALRKFLGEDFKPQDAYDIKVGVLGFKGQYHNTTTGVLAGLNVLGMDILQNAAPTLVPFLTESFAKLNDNLPMTEVLATDGKVTFPITPKQMKVMYLKKAIKEVGMCALPYPTLTIKNPEGVVLGDKDDLQPGMEYTYVLPHSR
jgi:hypothetical protein